MALPIHLILANVVEVRQLVDHRLHLLAFHTIREGEGAHVDPLGAITRVDVGKDVRPADSEKQR